MLAVRWKNASDFTCHGTLARKTFREDFFGGLHQALGPAGLLRFEAVHVYRQLGRALDVRQIQKLPAFQLRAIREIGVFGERVVLPAAGLVNGFAAPHSGGAVEIEKSAAAGTRAVFDHKMAVEQDGFHLSEQRVIGIEIGPASLHHADARAAAGIHEIGNGEAQKIGRRHKVGVKNRDELSLGSFQSMFERAGFVAFAIGAMDVGDGHALRGEALHTVAGDFLSFVGGVVEDLHVEQLGRVIETGDGFDQALDDVPLIINGKLNGDARPLGDRRRRGRNIFGVLVIIVDQPVTV